MESTVPVRKDNYIWDFVLLNPLTEDTFLRTLFCRYKQDQIYVSGECFIKSRIVILLSKIPMLRVSNFFNFYIDLYRE